MNSLKKLFHILSLTLFSLLVMSTVCFAEKPDIKSDSQRFDFSTMRYVLDGNVTVSWSNRVIKADHAQVSIATLEVWAQDNITLRQDDIFFRGDVLHVAGGSNSADINGNTLFERGDLKITADNASFSWDTKIADFKNNVKITEAGNTRKINHLQYNVITGEFILEE